MYSFFFCLLLHVYRQHSEHTKDIIIVVIIIPKHIIYLLNSLNIYVFAHELSFYLWSWAIIVFYDLLWLATKNKFILLRFNFFFCLFFFWHGTVNRNFFSLASIFFRPPLIMNYLCLFFLFLFFILLFLVLFSCCHRQKKMS